MTADEVDHRWWHYAAIIVGILGLLLAIGACGMLVYNRMKPELDATKENRKRKPSLDRHTTISSISSHSSDGKKGKQTAPNGTAMAGVYQFDQGKKANQVGPNKQTKKTGLAWGNKKTDDVF